MDNVFKHFKYQTQLGGGYIICPILSKSVLLVGWFGVPVGSVLLLLVLMRWLFVLAGPVKDQWIKPTPVSTPTVGNMDVG